MMIIGSSGQVPRTTLLKRFPRPAKPRRRPGIPYRAREGVPTPAGAERVNAFEIYRYTLTPTITRRDTFEVDLDDCDPMVLRCAPLDQEQGRPDPDLPPLVARYRT